MNACSPPPPPPDMSLDTEITSDERELVGRLLDTHSAEHIAAAFIRQYRVGQSAPEDLLPADYKTRQERVRTNLLPGLANPRPGKISATASGFR